MQAPDEAGPYRRLPEEAYPDFEEIEDEMTLREAELILFEAEENSL